MPKIAKVLAPVAVAHLSKPGFHPVGGVAGLGLQIVPSHAKSWVLRVMVGGKRRKMGLGGFPQISLARAREKALQARDLIESGVDPIDQRKDNRRNLKAGRAKDVTFKTCAEAYIQSHKAQWTNDKHGNQWSSTLEKYAYPVIGELWVRDVQLEHIMRILEPIWSTKTATATRLRGRIETVLDSAKTKGFRSEANPAAWKGNLATVLPSPKKITRVRHYPAVAVTELGSFIKALRQQEGVSALALYFLILTNVRSHNVRHATWGEIDLDTNTWDIPGEDSEDTGQRMKMGVSHRVPLSKQALKLLNDLPRTAESELLFPSPRKGIQLSDMAMNKVMRDMKARGVPHGFRSTFRDWALDYTNYQSVIAEKALAHAVGDQTVRAYLRSDAYKKRRKMTQDWADFCDIERAASTGKVVSLRQRSVAA